MGRDKAFLGDGKTCLDIMDAKERESRAGNVGPDWVDFVCHVK